MLKLITTTFSAVLLLALPLSSALATSFAPLSSPYPLALAPFSPYAVVSGDFNNDSHDDAAITVDDGSNGYVRVFLWNNTTASLDFSGDLATGAIAASGPRGAVLADLNRDGNTDIAIANYNDCSVSVFLGNGDGSFQTRTDYPLGAGTGPVAIAGGDFSGGGLQNDLAVLNATDNSVAILLNDGSAVFTLQSRASWPATTDTPTAIAVGDFNGDDIADIVVARGGANSIRLFRGLGIGSFAAGIDSSAVDKPVSLAVADFNNDRLDDLAVAINNPGVSASVQIFLGDKEWQLTPAATYQAVQPYANTVEPEAVIVADLNRDGLPDLAVANKAFKRLSVLPGAGDGTFLGADQFMVDDYPLRLAAGDLTGGGNELLSVSTSPANSFSVLFNTAPAAPGLTVTPGAHDFGKLQIGHQAYLETMLTLSNPGSGPLSVATMSLSGTNSNEFLVLPQYGTCGTTTPTIAAGGSCTVQVRFKEVIREDSYTAVLTVTSNAAVNPAVAVPLSGTGVAFTMPYSVNVRFIGRGGGTVSFSSGDAGCSADCTRAPPEMLLNLTALPAGGSYLYDWSGCDSAFNGSCVVDMQSNQHDRQLTVNFGLVPRQVKLVAAQDIYTSTIGAAYASATGNGEIRSQAGLLPEDLVLGRSIPVIVKGGYDAGFTAQDTPTILRSLTIAAGSAELENIVLQ